MPKSIRLSLSILFLLFLSRCSSDEPEPNPSYFPPATGTWETTSPASLGWDESKISDLNSFLQTSNTRAFILLKDGKIVIESYFGKQFDNVTNFTASSNWYWASAGKTLTAAAVGVAYGDGSVNLDVSSASYLGSGWSALTSIQENLITVRHHLTMTTGLDDGVANPDCTDKPCLIYKAIPGSRWAYHNAPYTLLDKVVQQATGVTLNEYVKTEILDKTGMSGVYIKNNYNNVFYSNARSMARFGLLLLNEGNWAGTQIIPADYFELMTNTSQNLNLSYGYLTWLNGKSSFMSPGLQTVFPISLTPEAPADMFASMGKNGQLINIVPSQNLVMIRMGDAPDNSLVPFDFQKEIWNKINAVLNQ